MIKSTSTFTINVDRNSFRLTLFEVVFINLPNHIPTQRTQAIKVLLLNNLSLSDTRNVPNPPRHCYYRPSGDSNTLHSDSMIAEIAGFPRPVLHRVCALGFAVRPIIKCICRGDQNMVRSISGPLLLHVYTAETLITKMWLEDFRVLHHVKVKERSKSVLSGSVVLNLSKSNFMKPHAPRKQL